MCLNLYIWEIKLLFSQNRTRRELLKRSLSINYNKFHIEEQDILLMIIAVANCPQTRHDRRSVHS
jgi:hypothetical protein